MRLLREQICPSSTLSNIKLTWNKPDSRSKLIYNIYKYSVRTSQRNLCTSIRKSNRLMLYRELIITHCIILTLCEQNVEFLMLNPEICR
jgi:hypothetical protein